MTGYLGGHVSAGTAVMNELTTAAVRRFSTAHRTLVVADGASGRIWWDHQGERPVAAASTVKPYLAYAALCSWTAAHRVTVGELTATTRRRTVLAALASERELSVEELAVLLLITSDNCIAAHLWSVVGEEPVQHCLNSAGMRHTIPGRFDDESLSSEDHCGTTTARDAVCGLRWLLEQRRVGNPAAVRVWRGMQHNLMLARLATDLPEGVGIVHKTGTCAHVVADVGVLTGTRMARVALVAAFDFSQSSHAESNLALAMLGAALGTEVQN